MPPVPTKSVPNPYPLIRLPALNQKPSNDWAEALDTCCPELCFWPHEAALGFTRFAGSRKAEWGRDEWEQCELSDEVVCQEGRLTKPGKARAEDIPPNLFACVKWADAQGVPDPADQRSFT